MLNIETINLLSKIISALALIISLSFIKKVKKKYKDNPLYMKMYWWLVFLITFTTLLIWIF